MTPEEAEVKIKGIIEEVNAAGYAVLTSILDDDGYHLEEVMARDINVVKRDDELFGS